MEFQGISVVIIWHEGEGDQKRGLHSTHLLQNTPLLSHVSISFGFLTGLWRHFVLESDLFLWPDVGLFFLRRWIWTRLLWFDFVDINWDTYYQFSIKLYSQPPLRNAVPREITVTYCDPWMGCILRPKLIALDFRKRTRERMRTLRGNHICFRKSLSQTFNLIRLDFSSMSPRCPFFCCFVATQASIRNAHKWFEGEAGSTRLEDTPAMDLQLKSIRTHM